MQTFCKKMLIHVQAALRSPAVVFYAPTVHDPRSSTAPSSTQLTDPNPSQHSGVLMQSRRLSKGISCSAETRMCRKAPRDAFSITSSLGSHSSRLRMPEKLSHWLLNVCHTLPFSSSRWRACSLPMFRYLNSIPGTTMASGIRCCKNR